MTLESELRNLLERIILQLCKNVVEFFLAGGPVYTFESLTPRVQLFAIRMVMRCWRRSMAREQEGRGAQALFSFGM